MPGRGYAGASGFCSRFGEACHWALSADKKRVSFIYKKLACLLQAQAQYKYNVIEPTSHLVHSFGEQKGSATGYWEPVFKICWLPLGKEERLFQRSRALDSECSLSSAFWDSMNNWAWSCDPRPPSPSSMWLWVTFRVMLKFLYFLIPQGLQVGSWPPKKVPHLFLRIPSKRCLLCVYKPLSAVPSAWLFYFYSRIHCLYLLFWLYQEDQELSQSPKSVSSLLSWKPISSQSSLVFSTTAMLFILTSRQVLATWHLTDSISDTFTLRQGLSLLL